MGRQSLYLRDGIVFYHWGDGYLADYLGSTVAYLSKTEYSFICDIVSGETNEEIPVDVLEKLIKTGIISKKKNASGILAVYGKEGYYYPKELAVEVTNTCNYRCPFCYKNATNNGHFITNDLIDRILEFADGNIKSILLTGGEPTLHPGIADIINRFSKTAEVNLITNGSKLFEINHNYLEKLSFVQFSLYGLDDKNYKQITGCTSGFSRLLKSVDALKKTRVPYGGSVTICEYNADDLEKYAEVAKKLNMSRLKIGIADSFGRAADKTYSVGVDLEKRERIYSDLLRLKREFQNSLTIEVNNIELPDNHYKEEIVKKVVRGTFSCGCGSEYLVVNQNGKVRPCQMLPEEYFSYESLDDIAEHLAGDFHVCRLNDAFANYCRWSKGEKPCEALRNFVLGGNQ